jgi:NADPH-dependent curcumin reductase CurA
MSTTYQRIVLAERPKGAVNPSHFRLETILQANMDSLMADEVLVKNLYLSLDPYMRGRMSLAKSYAEAQALNETMLGATVGAVVASKHARFQIGDFVLGMLGWAEMGVANGNVLRRIDADPQIPLTAYLGILGMPGVTAWYGVHEVLQAKAGQTLVVSAASGAVGSVVGQLAKLRGCRVVGIAGGPEKCSYVLDKLGFDVCIDYQQSPNKQKLSASLNVAIPNGIDLLFENVGSMVFDASLACLNPHAKIALCGMIAGYNGGAYPLNNINKLLIMRANLQGFIITEHMEVWPQALQELTVLFKQKKIMCHETVALGLASAPEAFIGLFNGTNLGKQLVRLS